MSIMFAGSESNTGVVVMFADSLLNRLTSAVVTLISRMFAGTGQTLRSVFHRGNS